MTNAAVVHSELKTVKTPALVVSSTVEGEAIHMKLVGNADTDAREAIAKMLDEVHFETRRQNRGELVVELAELYFMNSSCLSIFVRWLNNLDGDYKVRFLCNPTLRWQRRNLMMLSAFAPSRVVIEP